jgi:hypothetical protein
MWQSLLKATQLFKKFRISYLAGVSLPCSQQQFTGPYHEWDDPSAQPHPHVPFSCYSSICAQVSQMVSYLQVLRPASCYQSLLCVLRARHITRALIWLPEYYMDKSRNFKVPYFIIFSYISEPSCRRFKFSPLYAILKNPSNFIPLKTEGKITSVYVLVFTWRQRFRTE